MRIAVGIIISVLLMSACTMPDTKIYSLNVGMSAERGNNQGAASGQSVAVTVNSPRYLSQSFIAFRTSPYELSISKYSKWEAPPQEMLRAAVKNYLSSAGVFKEVRVSNVVPEGYYILEIELKRFERDERGTDSYGCLSFDYVLYSPDGVLLYRGIVSKDIRLQNRDFLDLAKGLSTLLGQAVRDVADAVSRKIVK